MTEYCSDVYPKDSFIQRLLPRAASSMSNLACTLPSTAKRSSLSSSAGRKECRKNSRGNRKSNAADGASTTTTTTSSIRRIKSNSNNNKKLAAAAAKPSQLILSRPRLSGCFKSLSFRHQHYQPLKNSPSPEISTDNNNRNRNSSRSSLFQLVARRDWQMVLIRASLFPSEIRQSHRFAWDGVEEWNVLPLHLACALDPPALVIEKLLCGSKKNNSKNNDKDDATTTCVTATMTMTKRSRHRSHGKSRSSIIRRRRLRRNAGGDHDRRRDVDVTTTEESSSIPRRFADLQASPSSSLQLLEQKGSSSSSSSRAVQPLDNDEKHRSPDSRSALASNGRNTPWAEADSLLPLHVACLYRASPAVIQHLCQAHPAGARCWAWGGRLPIHMLASQLIDKHSAADDDDESNGKHDHGVAPPVATATVLGLSAPPPTPTRRCDDWRLADALQHLVDVYPESVSVPSRTTNRTPLELIEEMMDDGINKRMCLRVLGREVEEEEEEDTLSVEDESETSHISEVIPVARPIPSEILCDEQQSNLGFDDDDNDVADDMDAISAGVGWRAPNELYALMVARKWECAYDLLEDEPEQAHKWQYGIEMDTCVDDNDKANNTRKEAQMWKRLPIHNCCRLGAPLALLSIVLRHNPSCPADPYTGALPIHLACQYAPSLESIHLLLLTDPACTKQKDDAGLLPIHYACRQKAPTLCLQALLKSYPGSVMVQDKGGKTPLDYCCLESTDAGVIRTMSKLQCFLGRVERRKKQSAGRQSRKTSTEGVNDNGAGLLVPCLDVVSSESDGDDCDSDEEVDA